LFLDGNWTSDADVGIVVEEKKTVLELPKDNSRITKLESQ